MTVDPSAAQEGPQEGPATGRQGGGEPAPDPGRDSGSGPLGDDDSSTATTDPDAGPPAGRRPQPVWTPDPGWYPDPLEPGRLRHWDGRGWSARTRPAPDEPAGDTRPGTTPTPHETLDVDGPPGGSDRADPLPTRDQPTRGRDAVMTRRAGGGSASWGRWETPATAPESPAGMRPVSAVFTAIPTVLGAGWRPLLLLSLSVWSAAALLTAATLLTALDVADLYRTMLDFVDSLENAGDLAAVQAAWDASISAAAATLRWSGPTTGLLLVVLGSGLFLLSALMITGSLRVAQRALGDGASGHPPPTSHSTAIAAGPGSRGLRLGWAEGLREAVVRLPRVIGPCAVVMPALGLPWLLLGLWFPLAIWVVTTGSAVLLSAVLGAAVAAVCLMLVTAGRLTPALPRAALSRGALRWSWRVTRGRFWAVLARIAVWVLVLATLIQLILGVVVAPLAAVGSPEDAATWLVATSLWLLSIPGYVTVTGWYAIGLVPIADDLAAGQSAATVSPAGSVRQPGPSADLNGPGSPPPSGSAAS